MSPVFYIYLILFNLSYSSTTVADENNQWTVTNKNRKEFYLSKLRTSLEACFPDYSEKLLRRSRVFSTVFLSGQRTLNTSGLCFFKLSKKKRNSPARTQQVNMALTPGKGIKGVQVLASQEERHLIFIFIWTIFTFGHVFFPLIIKAHVQCMFDRPQTGYVS